MGIDKEKLISAIQAESNSRINRDFYCDFIRNFPEEPEQPIDFDALYNEYYRSLSTTTNRGMPYKNTRADSFRDFLKSKNLTVPVSPVKLELPVKWELKTEYSEYLKDMGAPYPPLPKDEKILLKYFECKPIYAHIPDGTLVVVSTKDFKVYMGIVGKDKDFRVRYMDLNHGSEIPPTRVYMDDIEVLEILKEAPNGN